MSRMAVLAALVIVVATLVVRMTLADSGTDTVALDVPQTSYDSHGGVKIAVDLSRFSGTATLARVTAEIESEVADGVSEVRGLTLRIGDGSELLLPGESQEVFVMPGEPGLLRLSRLRGPGPSALLQIASVTVVGTGGEERVVEGPWDLRLSVPGDYASFMAVHTLHARGSVQVEDAAVRVISARASNTETAVTIELSALKSGAFPVPVGAATITTKGGDVLLGRETEQREEGRLRTYEFPPTPRGEALRLTLPAFAVSDQNVVLEELDLGKALSRSPNGGRVPLLAGEVSASNGLAPRMTSVELGIGTDRISPVLIVELRANFAGEGSFALTLPDGTVLAPMTVIDAMSRDATGTVGVGSTTLRFKYDSLDQLSGKVVLSYGGGVRVYHSQEQSIELLP